MARGPRFRVAYRRRREGKTEYRKRLKLLLSGEARLVVRKSLGHIWAQVIEYSKKGDKTIASCHSKELRKLGWKGGTSNIPAAYLVGFVCGLRAKEKKIEKAVLDIGLNVPIKGSKVFATLKGASDAGMEIRHETGILPSEGRIKGEHIARYAKIEKKRFSKYIERGLNPEDMPQHFDEILNKVRKWKK
jgi:large subunit ribosomal protein L18